MKRTIAALFGLAVLATATPASAHTHPGWQHNPRNPHYVWPVKTVPTCSWVIGNAIGDVPHCV